MKSVWVALAGAVLWTVPAGSSQAATGWKQVMEFVTETEIADDTGKALALCHLIKRRHVMFFPYYYESEGYVLAENGCDTDSYYELPAARLASARTSGQIPGDVPIVPQLSRAQIAVPYFWGVLVGFAVIIGLWRRFAAPRGRRAHRDLSAYTDRVLEVACRAALADGQIEDREVGVIAGIASSFTTSQISPQRMRQMIEMVRSTPAPADFSDYGIGMAEMERDQILRVAMLVIGRSGMQVGSGKAFIDRLAQGLLIDETRRAAIAQSV